MKREYYEVLADGDAQAYSLFLQLGLTPNFKPNFKPIFKPIFGLKLYSQPPQKVLYVMACLHDIS